MTGVACYQKVIQEKHRCEEEPILRGWLDQNEVTLSNSWVKRISVQRAKPIIKKHEWLGTMPGWTEFAFGHFWGDKCGGALLFGHTTGAHNSFDSIFPDREVIQLQRGVSLWWTPKNSPSYFIARACRWLAENTNYDTVTATADEEAGEIGTIYQALNWTYLGRGMGGDNYWSVVDGEKHHPKTMYDRHGTSSREKLRAIYGDRIAFEKIKKKHRYAYALHGDLSVGGQPYPKRDSTLTEDKIDEYRRKISERDDNQREMFT